MWNDAEIMSVPFHVADVAPPVIARRRALVVGNGAYLNLLGIPSASAETAAVTQALRQDGFDVTSAQNLTLDQWRSTEREFIGKVQQGDVVLVYFTGYAVQRSGDNWLLTASYNPSDNLPLTAKAYSVLRLRQLLEDKQVRLAMIVLNAAREHPALKASGQSPGLAKMDGDAHTILVYAIPPGQVEKTPGDASVGPFGQAFVKVIQRPSIGLQQLLLADLPKAVTAIAAARPVPFAVVQTSEEFVFRTPPSPPRELTMPPDASVLYGQWQFSPTRPDAGPNATPCTFVLTSNQGRFGNVISGGCTPSQAFWRLERDRLHVINANGLVTYVLYKTSYGWKGNSLVAAFADFELKPVPPPDAKKNPGVHLR
jgi:hypothetical protein